MTAISLSKTREVVPASGVPHESKKCLAQLGDKILAFDEHRILGDGNCGFTSLGTTREEVSSLLLSLAADEKSRIELADEIQGLLRENRESKLHTKETQKLFAEWDTAQADVDEQVRQLNNQLATETKTTEAKTILSAAFQRQNLEGLIERLKDSSYSSHQTALTTLSAARLQILQIGEKIKLCCQSREIFEHYIVKGLACTEWLGYRSAKLFAKLKQYDLYIFHPAMNKPSWLELAEQQVCTAPKDIFYLLHTNGFTHYNLLSIAPTPASALLGSSDAPERKTSVPTLAIDLEALKNHAARITHPKISAILEKALIRYQSHIKKFNEDIQSSLMTKEMLETAITDLENLIKNDKAEIEDMAGGSVTSRDVFAILDAVKTACKNTKQQLNPSPIAASKPDTHWQEDRLAFEQELFLPGKPLTEIFHQAFGKIKETARKNGYIPPGEIFICYAWPDAKAESEKHLTFLQTFLKNLRDHLKKSGIHAVKLDITDNPAGGNIYTYMQSAETSDFVLLMGTESLLRKHRSGTSAVCSELIRINRKRIKDREQGKYRILPLLISGDIETAFPEHYELYTTISDWKGTKTYFEHLRWLINVLYKTKAAAFETIWAEFLTAADKIHPDAQLVLCEGITQTYVLEKQQVEKKHRAEKETKRDSAGRALDALVKKLEGKADHKTAETKEEWHLPRYNEASFTGRDALLKTLHEHFTTKTSRRMVLSAIAGLGGVGKTTLATHYIHQAAHYPLRFWFRADNLTALQSDYAAFAKEFRLVSEDKTSAEEVVRAVKNFLNQRTDWLAVYDNAGTYQELESYLPERGGHLIITTRQREWREVGVPIEISVFTSKEAIEYLQKAIGSPQDQEIEGLTTLAKRLGYLPLALAQAAAYIKRTGKTVADYLSFYDRQKALPHAELFLPSQHEPVATTWQISLQAIAKEESHKNEAPVSLALLQAMAYLAADHIPRSLLMRWSHISGLTSEKDAEGTLDKALAHLQNYSLIQLHSTQRTISVHCVVQEVTRLSPLSAALLVDNSGQSETKKTERSDPLKATVPTRLLRALTDSLEEEFERETQVLADEARRKALLSHAQTVARWMEQTTALSVSCEFADLLWRIGNVLLYQLSDPHEAKSHYERALAIQEAHDGPKRWEVAIILRGLANANGDLGDAGIQKTLLERALVILETHYGPEHGQVAIALNSLGHVHRTLGDTSQALKLLERALAIEQKSYPASHLEIARTLINLGLTYWHVGETGKALPTLQQALMVRQKHYDIDHPKVAIVFVYLSMIYLHLKENSKSYSLLKTAFTIYEKECGISHASLISLPISPEGEEENRYQCKMLLTQIHMILQKKFGAQYIYTREITKGLIKLGWHTDKEAKATLPETKTSALTISQQAGNPDLSPAKDEATSSGAKELTSGGKAPTSPDAFFAAGSGVSRDIASAATLSAPAKRETKP